MQIAKNNIWTIWGKCNYFSKFSILVARPRTKRARWPCGRAPSAKSMGFKFYYHSSFKPCALDEGEALAAEESRLGVSVLFSERASSVVSYSTYLQWPSHFQNLKPLHSIFAFASIRPKQMLCLKSRVPLLRAFTTPNFGKISFFTPVDK